MYRLFACADTLFLHLPFEERVKKICMAGFLAEFWLWDGRDMDALAADPKIQVNNFVIGPGDGCMVHPDNVEGYFDNVEEGLAIAKKLRCRRFIALSGGLSAETGASTHPVAEHPIARWVTAYKALRRLADIAEQHDVVFSLEHLNVKIDHPGYPLANVEDAARLVREVDSPGIKLLLDLYHAQVQEGNLIELIREYHDIIGHIHVADVPGRHEPGTGEINYTQVVETLHEVGYDGVVGLEAFPENDDYQAMDRFREIFG